MRKILMLLVVALCGCMLLGAKSDPDNGCDSRGEPVSTSGVRKDTVRVQTNPEGRTVEQENVRDRLKADNMPGSIKHLYVISAYSGQVILYSTVRGKVTSGGKRLSPSTVAVNKEARPDCIDVEIGDRTYCTTEVLGDDGAYGSSGDYLFWFDSKGVYHQHFVSGGQIVHVTSEPLAVKSIIINVETGATEKPTEIPVEVKAGAK